MSAPLVAIFHQPPRPGDPPLTVLLARARHALVDHHRGLFGRAGGRVVVVPGRAPGAAETFGERLARLVADERLDAGGLVVMGSGAVPLLRLPDARRLVAVAGAGGRLALTNNRYSSDVCALGDAASLRALPPLPTDNALPRWLEEQAGMRVEELTGRDRLAMDLDTPLDLGLLAHVPGAPAVLRALVAGEAIMVPRLEELRALSRDPRRELLVAGRSGARTLRWLERSVRCRVRFLAEERGLRASWMPAEDRLPQPPGVPEPGPAAAARARPPRSTIGRLLELLGPDALGSIVAELADGAIVDTRVLLADRLGADDDAWPSPEDRFASDLLRPDLVRDPWLRSLTEAAAGAPIPVLLGAHTVVGPGVRWLLR